MTAGTSTSNLYEIPLKRIDGSAATLNDYKGKVLLIVNVASKCGLTPQYEGLEKLYQQFKDQGFEVFGFPCNDFMEQEPGSENDIVSFCTTNYDVHFPLFSKIAILGANKHPLYTALVSQKPSATGEGPMREKLKGYGVVREDQSEILWNFEKFLVNKDGKVVARFSPDVTAEDPRIVDAVKSELK